MSVVCLVVEAAKPLNPTPLRFLAPSLFLSLLTKSTGNLNIYCTILTCNPRSPHHFLLSSRTKDESREKDEKSEAVLLSSPALAVPAL